MLKQRRFFACALLLVSAALLLSGCAREEADVPVPEGSYVRIQVDGKTLLNVPLSEPQTVTVRQEGGAENVIRVTERGAVMEQANCHNQDCVHMGEVTLDNWEYRVNGAFIICLPHRVTVELVAKE